MAQLQRYNTDFSMAAVAQLVPETVAFFTQDAQLHPDLLGQFDFPCRQSSSLPFVAFDETEIRQITAGAELVYAALVDSLALLFDRYQHLISRFYGAEFVRHYPEFIKYAEYTYRQNHEAIYGRFDMAYDFDAGKLLCAYEFNGDTPVMLFESVQLQHWLLQSLGRESQQCNTWFEAVQQHKDKLFPSGSSIGIIGARSAIEDALTLETLQTTLADFNVHLVDISAFEFDSARQRFSAHDIEFDHVFILMPWEEMVEASPEVIANWRQWKDNVRFLEPAWRWFIANKGGLAWLYWLLSHSGEQAFQQQYAQVLQYLPRSQMSPIGMTDYVSKPLMGRLSANISIFQHGQKVKATAGPYEATDLLYQEYRPTGKIGTAYGIVGVWMAPWGTEPLTMEAATVCVRAHDNEVTDIGNERFLPHIITD